MTQSWVTIFLILTLIIMILLISCQQILEQFSEPVDRIDSVNWVLATCLTITLLAILLIPVDIQFTSNHLQDIKSYLFQKEILKIIWVVTILLISFNVVVLLPLVYNYSDEFVLDDYKAHNDDAITTFIKNLFKIWPIILSFAISFIFLLIFRENSLTMIYAHLKSITIDKHEIEKLIEDSKILFDMKNNFEGLVVVILGSLIPTSCIQFCRFTLQGMVVLPYHLTVQSHSLPQIKDQLEDDLASVRDHQRQIHLKAVNGKATTEERKLMKRLKYEERLLLDRSDMLSFDDHNWVELVLSALKPLKIIMGILFAIIGMLLVLSNCVSALDRLLHSQCGLQCGFALLEGSGFGMWTNPLDWLLSVSGRTLYTDLILITLVLIQQASSSMQVFMQSCELLVFGSWVQNEQLKEVNLNIHLSRKKTYPLSLVLFVVIVSLTVFNFVFQIQTTMPNQSTFGNQFIPSGGENKQCTMTESLKNECQHSALSDIMNKLILSQPFLALFVILFNAMQPFIACQYLQTIISNDMIDKNRKKQQDGQDYEVNPLIQFE